MPPGALFQGKREAACQGLLAVVAEPRHIVRMKHPGPKVRSHHRVQREPRVREHGLIRIQRAPIRPQDDDGLRDGIDDLAQLLFIVPELLLMNVVEVLLVNCTAESRLSQATIDESFCAKTHKRSSCGAANTMGRVASSATVPVICSTRLPSLDMRQIW